MKILGINCFAHDSAAALLIDGEIVFAVEEERLNRDKHTGAIPFLSITECLKNFDLSLNDVDHVCFFMDPRIMALYAPKFIFQHLRHIPGLIKEQKGKSYEDEDHLGLLNHYFDILNLPRILVNHFCPGEKQRFKFHNIEHHFCHAASAFYPSGFNESAVISIDGVGEWTTAMIAFAQDNNIKVLSKVTAPHSMGAFYLAIARHLGFKISTGAGKLMGLSSYGDKGSEEYRKMKKLVILGPNGTFKLNMDYFCFHYTRKTGVTEKFEQLFGPSRKIGDNWSEQELNVAAAAQKIIEDVMLHMADYAYKKTKSKNLCLAGGVALNSVANGLLTKHSPFSSIFVQPAAGDSGTALGSALYHYFVKLKAPNPKKIMSAYLGPKYTDEECKESLKRFNVDFKSATDAAKEAAKFLSENKVIAWFNGRLEFGPRALGHRSIFANPLDKNISSVLNSKVKFREAFRPYAAIVHEEDCGKYFDCDAPSPFMLQVYNVKPEFRDILPGITHVDKTVRVQTVRKGDSSGLYELLEEFKKLSGYSVLINTSFNIKGEPIVCTPDEAIQSFLKSKIDHLFFENLIASKKADQRSAK